MRPLRLVLLLAGMLVLIAAEVAIAQEGGGVQFVVEPVPGSSTSPDGGYFLITTIPGAEVRQAIGIRNDSPSRLELRLAAVDAVTGQLGGASYALDTEAAARMGAWITLERTSLTLEPKASAVVPFRIAVPAGAEGVHLAGISVAAPSKQRVPGAAGKGQAGASVDVQTRRIVAVQVNLPGSSEPELVITGVSPAARPDGLYLQVAIENRGRGLTKGEGTVTLVDDGFKRAFTVDTFVPGTSIAYPVKWSDDAEDGDYQAEVEIRYSGRVAQWTGSFTVDEAVRQELADRRVEVPRSGKEDGGIPLAAVAGGMVAGGLITAGAAIAVRRLRRPHISQGAG
jgi:hypothetical protein